MLEIVKQSTDTHTKIFYQVYVENQQIKLAAYALFEVKTLKMMVRFFKKNVTFKLIFFKQKIFITCYLLTCPACPQVLSKKKEREREKRRSLAFLAFCFSLLLSFIYLLLLILFYLFFNEKKWSE